METGERGQGSADRRPMTGNLSEFLNVAIVAGGAIVLQLLDLPPETMVTQYVVSDYLKDHQEP